MKCSINILAINYYESFYEQNIAINFTRPAIFYAKLFWILQGNYKEASSLTNSYIEQRAWYILSYIKQKGMYTAYIVHSDLHQRKTMVQIDLHRTEGTLYI